MTDFPGLPLRTSRLLLRPYRPEEAPALFSIFSDPQVMRYWSTPPWSSVEQAHRAVHGDIKSLESGQQLRPGIERIGDCALIGQCTLFNFARPCRRAGDTMKRLAAIILFFCIVTPIPAPAGSPFDGTWKVIRERSSNIDYYQSLTTDLSVQKDRVTIVRTYGPRRGLVERMTVKPDGSVARVPIGDPTFATNLFMGLKLAEGMTKDVTVTFSGDTTLVLTETFDVLASQGTKRMRVTSRYRLSDHNTLLTCLIERDARTGHAALRFVFKRADQNNAYVYTMADDWEINGKLPEQACLISIQGIVNEQQPVLYFTFGPQFPFNYTEDLRSFLEQERHFTFTTMRSLEQALTVFKDRLSGYIVWDKNERTSLIVAYTLAGLEKGIVITEEMIPLAERYGLKKIDDFRNRFNGWPDHKIYRWAKEQYWSRCSKDVIIWLGGVHGSALMPNVADHGITQKVFFTDLSARATDTLELALTRELLADMKPLGSVMGWHSYKKDREEEWVTVTSGYALTVDGLNTLPNTSFLRNVPASPGFVFRNHHNIVPGKTYVPGKEGVRRSRADRRTGDRCVGETREGLHPVRVGGVHELPLALTRYAGVLLCPGHAERLLHRMSVRFRVHVSEGLPEEMAAHGDREGEEIHGHARPEGVRDHGLFSGRYRSG